MSRAFLPATREEMAALGWEAADIVLVTGDAYVDHPSFGVALIGRWLEAHGFRVAVLAQPRHDRPDDFLRFGTPRLFFGITSGNLDSIVANYSGNAKVRDRDDYSPNGNPYFGATRSKEERRRPDRAVIRYANLARAAARDTPIILGGLEASLRRFVHYDYQQGKLRQSVLADAKADLLVYGMGERAVVEIAQRLAGGRDLAGIAGTCERLTDRQFADRTLTDPIALPDWQAIHADSGRFLDAEQAIDRASRALTAAPLVQRQQAVWVVQHRPAAPLATEELDRLYTLPYCRAPHPAAGRVPAYEMIRHSLTIVRGCCGNCSFCAIARHQGPVVTCRSRESVLAEVKKVTRMADFRGTISDLGGPTANLYGTSCRQAATCKRHDCLYPEVCRQLKIDEGALAGLLEAAAAVPGVKHLFVSSGLRMELLLKTPKLLRAILLRHTPGAMKIAPEHTDPEVLRLMHKPGSALLAEFVAACRNIGREAGHTIHLTPYLIASHPGCTVAAMARLAETVRLLGLAVRQFQDFTPTPGTIATAMYVSGRDRDNGTPLFVARTTGERRAQRQALEQLLRPDEPRGRARQGRPPLRARDGSPPPRAQKGKNKGAPPPASAGRRQKKGRRG